MKTLERRAEKQSYSNSFKAAINGPEIPVLTV